MSVPIYQVDAFTERPFAGNPAAVVLLGAAAAAEWMQAVAAEMNLSETAFLWPEGEAWRLRWFTPAAEVDLCGHATLASAHVLWESGRLAPVEPARFETRSGRLVARRAGDGIELDFPARPARPLPPVPGLAAALGAEPVEVAASVDDYLVVLADADAVRALAPDLAALARLPARGVIVTAPAEAGRPCDFVSRFFAPAVGVPEDPVTGSAHCTLAVYWAERLGRSALTGWQLSRRGGRVDVRLAGDRVVIGGRAVTILVGELAAAAAG